MTPDPILSALRRIATTYPTVGVQDAVIAAVDEITRLRQDLAAARALLRSSRELLAAFDGCSRNNFANLAAEQVDSIDAALAEGKGRT